MNSTDAIDVAKQPKCGPHTRHIMTSQTLKVVGNFLCFSNGNTSFGPDYSEKQLCQMWHRHGGLVESWLSSGPAVDQSHRQHVDQTRPILHSGLSARGTEHFSQMSATESSLTGTI